jgi:putative ABC transport system ATP-binding protein
VFNKYNGLNHLQLYSYSKQGISLFMKKGLFYMFHIKNLRYKDILYIDELKIEEKQVTCIIGQSGGGKTTLLKMLNHMLSPDQGEIVYKGRSLFEWNPIALRREVVMLSQQPVMFEGNIRENLNFGRILSEKEPIDDEKLKEALKFVCLQKKLEDDVEQLSGGEKQRLALARIFLMDPEVFLLDEPTSALDKGTEEKIMDAFIRYSKEKEKTVIMVTHSDTIPKTYADKVITINKPTGDNQ